MRNSTDSVIFSVLAICECAGCRILSTYVYHGRCNTFIICRVRCMRIFHGWGWKGNIF